MSRRFERELFPATKPKRVRGGIKAQTQRGGFGTQWWAKRWIAVLESLALGARLARGRRYARAGQVLDIAIEPGRVTAKVQGSRTRPYAIAIKVATLGRPAWRRVTDQIVGEARFAAPLLAGDMPHEIEEAFASAGASLFPNSVRELHTECSCPDWSNPCKHVAAVYYLLGEEFDRDPFLLFTLRGAVKADIFATLAASPERESAHVAEPLPADVEAFWRPARPGGEAYGLGAAGSARARPRRLPAFPFWRGTESLRNVVAETDEAAAARALAMLAELAQSGESRE